MLVVSAQEAFAQLFQDVKAPKLLIHQIVSLLGQMHHHRKTVYNRVWNGSD